MNDSGLTLIFFVCYKTLIPKKQKLMKKSPLLLFSIIFISFFMALFLRTYFQGKKTEDFSATLEPFRSDFYGPGGRDILSDRLILKKKRFIAYGTYLEVPAGRYAATFEMASSSGEPASCQLQVASDKGKSLLVSQDVRLDHFPAVRDLSFQVSAKKEIEPRILYSSGSRDIQLIKVRIRWIRGIFPWLNILSSALLYGAACTFILLSLLLASRSTAEWKYYLSGFLFLAGCFLILRRAWMSEDAFITLRHMDNFLHGYGPVFNITERVEGFTHPLWLAVLAIFRGIGLSPKGAAIIPALAAAFAALYLLFFRIRIKDETGAASFLNPAAAILIGTSAFIDFGTSGMETALSYLLLVLYAKFLLENRWMRQPMATGLIVSFLTLTRPDFGIFMVLMLILYLYEAAKKNIQARHLVRFLTFPALLVGGYQIFRMGYYAALLPNPFYTKSGGSAYWSQGFKYLKDSFQGSLVPVILILAVLMFFVKGGRRHLKNRAVVLFSGLLHGFFVIRGGGDFMHGRFLLPAFLLITLSQTGAFDKFFYKKAAPKMACLAVCLIFFFSSLSVIPMQKRGQPFHNNVSDERYFYYKDKIIPLKHLLTDTMILMWKTIGVNYRNLSERAKMPIRIAYKNVGFTGFYSGPKVYVCDKLGLAEPVVARMALTKRKRPGHEKNAPFGYLMLRRLTFYDTPFPLWNKAAKTKYGVLWDLSPKTLQKLDFMLNENFKQTLDIRIVGYLNGLIEKDLPERADFLFFLHKFWLPYASKDDQDIFLSKYKKDIIDQYSENFQWIKNNSVKISSHLSRLQGPLDAEKFLGNIGYALKTGLTLKFSPTGPADK